MITPLNSFPEFFQIPQWTHMSLVVILKISDMCFCFWLRWYSKAGFSRSLIRQVCVFQWPVRFRDKHLHHWHIHLSFFLHSWRKYLCSCGTLNGRRIYIWWYDSTLLLIFSISICFNHLKLKDYFLSELFVSREDENDLKRQIY